MPSLVVGSVPRGEDYFGREELVERLWRRLATDNVLLVAPRRFGKTGAMFRLLDEPREPYRPVYINVEHLESPADFMVELLATLGRDSYFSRKIQALWEHTEDVFRQLRGLLSRIDLGSLKVYLREKTDVPSNWLYYGERLMERLAGEEPRLLLLLDEVPELVQHAAAHDPQSLAQFLRWFRAARTAPETKTRFVIGGSINLVSTLDRLGYVDTVNDLKLERIEPFDRRTADRFVRAIFEANEIELSPRSRQAILRRVGTAIPYLLAVFLTALIDRHRLTGAKITPTLLNAVFENDLFSGASPFFLHYYSRLQEYYPDDEARIAKAILSLVSRAEGPLLRDTLYQTFLRASGATPGPVPSEAFARLMEKLENDFYVVRLDDAYEFHSAIIKAWWKNQHGFQGQ